MAFARSLLAAAFLGALNANAGASHCLPRDVMLKSKHDKWKEELRGAMPMGEGGQVLAEILISPERTWTIIATDANGVSCTLFGGYDWPDITIPLPGKGA